MKFTLSIGFCDVGDYLPLARAAEAAGWDSLCLPDGLFWYEECSPYPYSETGERFWSPQTPFLDPFALASALGAATSRIGVYVNVLKLAVRNPLLVAKSATTAAALTGGRFGLGVGLSPWREDFELLGEAWDNRGPRSAEMVEIIRGVSRGGMFEYHGRYYDVPRLEMAPVPTNPMPIYFGGLVDAVFKRAARLGDGYIWWENARSGLADFPSVAVKIKSFLADAGRAAAPFELKAMPMACDAATVARLAEQGVTDIIAMPWFGWPGNPPGNPLDLQYRIDSVRRYAETIFPKFR